MNTSPKADWQSRTQLDAGLSHSLDLLADTYNYNHWIYALCRRWLGDRILVRDQRLYAGMIQRMLYNQADMMPYYRRILRERREQWLAAAGGQRSTFNTQHPTFNDE